MPVLPPPQPYRPARALAGLALIVPAAITQAPLWATLVSRGADEPVRKVTA
ncbi:hypothetical protein [Micromonospora sp. AB353]|uniref:hypothetical protein n=1 Tax=Micromonospora sp. AB353 TaxID=3413282 RepID=UPI003C1AAE02